MEQNKKYYAFISYKREDERWAKWLQHKLEHYKLPSNLNGRTDLPREIRPVFRDTSELNPGNLPQQIHDALVASRHLIVICSPHSAQSEWVNKEVETFIAMGKQDCIIPFIIEGRPYVEDSAEECFPPAIRNLPKEQELLGANITEMGRDAAAVKTVAQMFGIRFDTLWKRYEREQKHKRALIFVAAFLFVLSVLVVAVRIGQQNIRIKSQRDEIKGQRDEISAQNKKLEQNAVIMAQQMDSIQKQAHKISMQGDSITMANTLLKKERDKLQTALWDVYRGESLLNAEKANQLCDDGNYMAARMVAWDALPHNLEKPERPYTDEAEAALRRSFEYNSQVLQLRSRYDFDCNHLQFLPDGKHVIGLSCNDILVWDYMTGTLLQKWFYNSDGQDYWNGMGFISQNSSGTRVLFPCWWSFYMIDASNGRIVDVFFNRESYAKRGIFDDNNNRIVLAWSNGDVETINLYNKENNITTTSIECSLYSLGYIDFSTQQNLYLRNGDDDYKKVVVADINTSQIIHTFSHSEIVSVACFSPSGNKVVSLCGEDIFLWDLKSKKLIDTIKCNVSMEFDEVQISPDEKTIAIVESHGRYCILYDIESHSEIQRIEIEGAYENCRAEFINNSLLMVGNRIIDFHGNWRYEPTDTMQTKNRGMGFKEVPNIIKSKMERDTFFLDTTYDSFYYYDDIQDTFYRTDSIIVIVDTQMYKIGITDYCYGDSNKYSLFFNDQGEGTLWKDNSLIREFSYKSYYDQVNSPFISRENTYYGFEDEFGCHIINISTGVERLFLSGEIHEFLKDNKYIILDEEDSKRDYHVLKIVNFLSGKVVQEIRLPFNAEYGVSSDGEKIVIITENGCRVYPIYSMNYLYGLVEEQLPQKSQIDVIERDYTYDAYFFFRREDDDE